MYIWVVLATFLAAIASFTLAPRDDIRKVTVEPLAEAHVAKLINKHKAASKYIYSKMPYATNMAEDIPNLINNDNIIAFAGAFYNDDENYYSQMFCLSEDWKTASSNAADCDDIHHDRFIITYGRIPYRWLNQRNEDVEMPTTDFLNAIYNIVGKGGRMGYTVIIDPNSALEFDENKSHSPVGIKLRDETISIPLAIVNDTTFKTICDVISSGGSATGKTCLVYLNSF